MTEHDGGKRSDEEAGGKVEKTEAEWRAALTPEQYRVLREKGTERAFTGKYWNHHDRGTYACAACGNPLFDSQTKFESGTGWPSFTAPAGPASLRTHEDNSHFMSRTEVVCRSCGSHLGHVFDDGPEPTGLRYCMNSASLDFHKRAEERDQKRAAERDEKRAEERDSSRAGERDKPR